MKQEALELVRVARAVMSTTPRSDGQRASLADEKMLADDMGWWDDESCVAAYPDSSPTEQDRKKWREQAEERRRKEGIRPRKAGEIRWYVTNVGVESVYITAGEFDSDQYTSTQLEAMGRKAIMEPLRRLEAELDKIGLRVTRSNVSVGMRHTGLGYGKGPLVLMAFFNFEEKRVDRRLVDQAVKKVFG